MFLDSLTVIHTQTKDAAIRQCIADIVSKGESFGIETCLRNFWVVTDEAVIDRIEESDLECDVHRGAYAYEFLLRIVCGLESLVSGETEIFSQFKTAWIKYNAENHQLTKNIRPWMQKLISDTKAIRSQHLQGIGGASYGSLARKLICPEPKDEVLIIGAGQLAHAVGPLFSKSRLQVWNRNKERLVTLVNKLSREGRVIKGVDDENLAAAIRDVKHVVICTPMGANDESDWVAARLTTPHSEGSVVHLGGLDREAKHWNAVENFYSLTAVFELQNDQNEIKEQRLRKAREACHKKAQERHLMDAISLHHGWEDLTGF